MSKSQDLVNEMLLQIVELSNGRYSAPRSIISEGRKSARFFNVLSDIIRKEILSQITNEALVKFVTYASYINIPDSERRELNFTAPEARQSAKYLEINGKMFSCNLSEVLQNKSNYERLRATIAYEDKDLQEYLQAVLQGKLKVTIQFDFDNLAEVDEEYGRTITGGINHLILVQSAAILEDLDLIKYHKIEGYPLHTLWSLVEEGMQIRSTLIHELQHSYDIYRSLARSISGRLFKKIPANFLNQFKTLPEEYRSYLTYYLSREEIQSRIQEYFDENVMSNFEDSPERFIYYYPELNRSSFELFIKPVINVLYKYIDYVIQQDKNADKPNLDLKTVFDKAVRPLRNYLNKVYYQMLEHELDRIKKEHPELIPKKSLKPALP